MQNQVAVVKVNETAFGLFVRGSFISDNSKSLTGQDIEGIAESTAKALGGKPVFVSYNPDDLTYPIDWELVRHTLQSMGSLQGGLEQFTLSYSYIDAEQNTGRDTAVFQAEDIGHALEQLYNELQGHERFVLSVDDLDLDDPSVEAVVQEDDTDYRLIPVEGNKIEVTVGNLSVEVYQCAEGIEVNIYSMANQLGPALNSMFEFFE